MEREQGEDLTRPLEAFRSRDADAEMSLATLLWEGLGERAAGPHLGDLRAPQRNLLSRKSKVKVAKFVQCHNRYLIFIYLNIVFDTPDPLTN